MATKTERKNDWNTKNYDRVAVVVKAGDRAKLQAAAAAEGKSVNRIIWEAIDAARPGLLEPLDDTSKQKKQAGPEAAQEDPAAD